MNKNDPLFEYLTLFNENDILKSKSIKQYNKIKYNQYNNNYNQWKKLNVDKIFQKYNITGYACGKIIIDIYKEINKEFKIDLNELYKHSFRSPLEYIYNNKELRKYFKKNLKSYLSIFNISQEHKKFIVYFAVNFWHRSGILIKIGRTEKTAEERIKKATQTFNKNSFDILTYITNCEKTYEKELHEKFKKYNIPEYGKEVFYLDGDLEDFIINNCKENFNKNYILIGKI